MSGHSSLLLIFHTSEILISSLQEKWFRKGRLSFVLKVSPVSILSSLFFLTCHLAVLLNCLSSLKIFSAVYCDIFFPCSKCLKLTLYPHLYQTIVLIYENYLFCFLSEYCAVNNFLQLMKRIGALSDSGFYFYFEIPKLVNGSGLHFSYFSW